MVQDLDCNIRSPHARFADSFDVQVTPLYLEHVSKIGQHGNKTSPNIVNNVSKRFCIARRTTWCNCCRSRNVFITALARPWYHQRNCGF